MTAKTAARRTRTGKTVAPATRTGKTSITVSDPSPRKALTAEADPSNVYTIHSLGEIDVDTRLRKLPALAKDEARTLTDQIKATTVRLWLLVTEAHDRKAHLALGYETWADYVKAELKISESRSYQFLDTGHVMKALAAAGVNIEEVEVPPTRVVARIKDRLTDVKKAVSKAETPGEVDKALRALAREARPPRRGAVPPQREEGEATETSGAVAAAASAEAPEDKVQCPACRGSGRVVKSRAGLIRDLMSKIRSS